MIVSIICSNLKLLYNILPIYFKYNYGSCFCSHHNLNEDIICKLVYNFNNYDDNKLF